MKKKLLVLLVPLALAVPVATASSASAINGPPIVPPTVIPSSTLDHLTLVQARILDRLSDHVIPGNPIDPIPFITQPTF